MKKLTVRTSKYRGVQYDFYKFDNRWKNLKWIHAGSRTLIGINIFYHGSDDFYIGFSLFGFCFRIWFKEVLLPVSTTLKDLLILLKHCFKAKNKWSSREHSKFVNRAYIWINQNIHELPF